MTHNDITVGACYSIKISGRRFTVRVDQIRAETRYCFGRESGVRHVYDAHDVETGRMLTIVSSGKFSKKVEV